MNAWRSNFRLGNALGKQRTYKLEEMISITPEREVLDVADGQPEH